MRFEDLEQARVGILGLGREGQAVWRRIRACFPQKPLWLFAETAVADDFETQLNPGIDHYHCGPLEHAGLETFDVLVRSAGISPYRAELQELRSCGVAFTSASNLWFKENPTARSICVSGTKGKSTTTALIAHLLEAAGLKTCLAGNIGRPMLACDNTDVDWWVIELSSYQLVDLEAEPDIAVLLNLSDEHVDWHGGARQYHTDKLRLADLAASGRLIANQADPILAENLTGRPDTIWFNQGREGEFGKSGVSRRFERSIIAPPSLPGDHNRQNLDAALSVVDALNLEIPHLEHVLSTFQGLPHRLHLLGEKAGIRYVDDSISTTPVSVEAALQTIGRDDVVLLLGGFDRGLDWLKFAASTALKPPYAIITMPDNGVLIARQLVKAGVKPPAGLHEVTSLSEAVSLAQSLLTNGGCVLLSPGAASFPHFRDFEDRGNQFATFAGIEKSV